MNLELDSLNKGLKERIEISVQPIVSCIGALDADIGSVYRSSGFEYRITAEKLNLFVSSRSSNISFLKLIPSFLNQRDSYNIATVTRLDENFRESAIRESDERLSLSVSERDLLERYHIYAAYMKEVAKLKDKQWLHSLLNFPQIFMMTAAAKGVLAPNALTRLSTKRSHIDLGTFASLCNTAYQTATGTFFSI